MSQKIYPLDTHQDIQRKINKSVSGDPKFYVLKENTSVCVLC